MEKGVNVFAEDAKEQAEFSFVGDIKSVSSLIHMTPFFLLLLPVLPHR
jgi:hypothetical protein